ncbi:MAG: hypothetical protein HY767_03515, partial [Candidatus Omnitrophica bacterium]|nr:hypothetical protein [Candidatus Omnitrophota bacterium]
GFYFHHVQIAVHRLRLLRHDAAELLVVDEPGDGAVRAADGTLRVLAQAQLAERIVSLFHSEAEGKNAREEFDDIFKNKGMPDEIPTVKIGQKTIDIVSLLVEAKLVTSKSEARRLMEQGGVKIGHEKITDPKSVITIGAPFVLQCGKRKFVKIESGT